MLSAGDLVYRDAAHDPDEVALACAGLVERAQHPMD
jgi:hypothetical protein